MSPEILIGSLGKAFVVGSEHIPENTTKRVGAEVSGLRCVLCVLLTHIYICQSPKPGAY